MCAWQTKGRMEDKMDVSSTWPRAAGCMAGGGTRPPSDVKVRCIRVGDDKSCITLGLGVYSHPSCVYNLSKHFMHTRRDSWSNFSAPRQPRGKLRDQRKEERKTDKRKKTWKLSRKLSQRQANSACWFGDTTRLDFHFSLSWPHQRSLSSFSPSCRANCSPDEACLDHHPALHILIASTLRFPLSVPDSMATA